MHIEIRARMTQGIFFESAGRHCWVYVNTCHDWISYEQERADKGTHTWEIDCTRYLKLEYWRDRDTIS